MDDFFFYEDKMKTSSDNWTRVFPMNNTVVSHCSRTLLAVRWLNKIVCTPYFKVILTYNICVIKLILDLPFVCMSYFLPIATPYIYMYYCLIDNPRYGILIFHIYYGVSTNFEMNSILYCYLVFYHFLTSQANAFFG